MNYDKENNPETRAEFQSPVSVVRRLWEMPEVDVKEEYRKKIERIIQRAIDVADEAVALLMLVRSNP
jgi:hypothetical protein